MILGAYGYLVPQYQMQHYDCTVERLGMARETHQRVQLEDVVQKRVVQYIASERYRHTFFCMKFSKCVSGYAITDCYIYQSNPLKLFGIIINWIAIDYCYWLILMLFKNLNCT